MKSVTPLILSILPVFSNALFQHNSRPLLSISKPIPITSSCHRSHPCRRSHHLHYLTRATSAPSTTLQLLHRHCQSQIYHQLHYHPTRHHYINRRQHAMSTLGIDDKNDDSSMNGNSGTSPMKILGICGGIGSGKSTACQLMVKKLGCAGLIDADRLAHAVYEPGSLALQEIIDEFGTDILLDNDDVNNNEDDDSERKRIIDRKKLGAVVFKDANAMSKLEQIVWPHVRTKIEEGIHDITLQHRQPKPPAKGDISDDDNGEQNNNTCSSTKDIIIVEAAILLETDWHDLMDGLWVVQSSEDVAKSRLIQNRGMTEEEALLRIRAQQKRKGIVVANGGDGEVAGLRESIENGIVTAIITNDGSLEDLELALKETLADPTSFKMRKKEEKDSTG